MELKLLCNEWVNANRDARLIKKNRVNKAESLATYLLQVVGQSNFTDNKLATLSSDHVISFYDQSTLKQLGQIQQSHDTKNGKNINEIGFFKESANMLLSCGDDGIVNCWDFRNYETKPSISFSICKNTFEVLCCDCNADDSLIAFGTSKSIDDCFIYLYDLRATDQYLHKLAESHSKDVTQIKFQPNKAKKFCSSSIDGLVCLYDLNNNEVADQQMEFNMQVPFALNNNYGSESDENESHTDEDSDTDSHEIEDPDFMEQVFNTDSSVQRIGFLNESMSHDQEASSLFAITYTNDLFVWDLTTHDVLLMNKETVSLDENQAEQYDNFSYFDCFYYNSLKDANRKALTLCLADNKGNIKIVQNTKCVYDTNVAKKSDSASSKISSNYKRNMYHRDNIRSSYQNGKHLFTAGEDGFLFKWELCIAEADNGHVNDSNKRKERDSESKEENERKQINNKSKRKN